MNAEHEAIAVAVGEILGSLDAMCAVVPKAPKGRKKPKTGPGKAEPSRASPWSGFASKTFLQMFSVTDPAAALGEVVRFIQSHPDLKGRTQFLSHVVACCSACATAAKSGSWRALAEAHMERGNAAAVFSATHEHLHSMAVMRGNGGNSRGKANDALREFVLNEAREKHSGWSANDAGNEISKRFDGFRNDLSFSMFGKPNATFSNAPRRFAEWIRDDREKMKSSPVA